MKISELRVLFKLILNVLPACLWLITLVILSRHHGPDNSTLFLIAMLISIVILALCYFLPEMIYREEVHKRLLLEKNLREPQKDWVLDFAFSQNRLLHFINWLCWPSSFHQFTQPDLPVNVLLIASIIILNLFNGIFYWSDFLHFQKILEDKVPDIPEYLE